MEAYHAAALATAQRLVVLLGAALGMPPPEFAARPGTFDAPMATLRLISYGEVVSAPAAGIFGAGAHTDWGLLTLLAVDGPGLQICTDRDAHPQVWEDVQPVAGALVVNLGDMLERWSNGLFRSTLHRVLTSGRPRLSVPFFLEPNFECMVEALPTCCGPTNPPRWPPTTCGQHLLEKLRQTHGGFKEAAVPGAVEVEG